MSANQIPIRTGLLDFFRNSAGCQFVIPVYQRNYTWTAGKEVRQYLDDMKSVLNGEFGNHFLGIMIYLDTAIDFTAREFSVIDGQQRLTTTFLTLYAIKNLLKERQEYDQVKSLEGQYLTNPYSSAKMKYKLKPLVSDDEVYRCIVEDKFDDIDDSKSNVYKNYNYIVEYLKDLLVAGKSLNDILMAMNKLYVVCVPISENDNAQKIFESINATGVKLTASDLIRNFILMDLPSDVQETYYIKYWKIIEDYIDSDSKKLELFFRMFLTAQNRELPNKNEVYRLFVKWYKERGKNTEDSLKKIIEYASAYNLIYKKDINEVDVVLRPTLKEFRRILSDLPSCALMEFYLLYKNNKISINQFNEIVTVINTYLLRRSLCNFESSAITRLFPAFLRDVFNDCAGNYKDIVEIVKKDLILKNVGNAMCMPDDKKMREFMTTANMYGLRIYLRIVFDRIEHENNPAPVDLSMLSIDHLMPQTPSDEWLNELKVDNEIYQNNVHRLGNLALVAKIDNSAMGNKGWQYKNEVLKATAHLKMNEELLKIKKWNINEIDKRTKALTEKIISMYPYPKIKEEVIPKEEIFIVSEQINAKGFLSLDTGSIEVDIGSQLAKYDSFENYVEIEEERQRLLEEGIVAEIDGCLQFIKPYIFYPKNSKSSGLKFVANLILRNKKSGWECWKNNNGIVLKNLIELKKILS